MPAAAFVDTIARVARAASRDETRPHLTGVLVTASGNDLRMVATGLLPPRREGDQARLGAERVARGERAGPNAPGTGRIASAEGAETIGVAALENQVVFTVDDIVLSSRLVEGTLPELSAAAPRGVRFTSCGSTATSSSRWFAGSACLPRRTRRCG